MRKAQWAVSSNGPDWTDVTALQEAIMGIHECNVEWTVRTVTHGAGALLSFTVLAWVDTVEAHQTKEIASVAGAWPNPRQKEFSHAVFEALYRLDNEIGKEYGQMRLTE